MTFRSSAGRHFLFLQGPGGSFFEQLSLLLETGNNTTSRINVCAGDYILWRRNNATHYRGSYDSWHSFLRAYVISNGVTDIVLFSDSRPYHRIAKVVAEELDLNLFVFENGYLRPDWITLELGGVNGNSKFPRTRAEMERLPVSPPRQEDPLERPSKLKMYWPDIKFHFANTLFGYLFPRYRRHRSTLPLLEIIGHGVKWLTWPIKILRSRKALERLFNANRPFYLFALQLEHDYQLIEHSPFQNMHQAAERVIESFALNAPQDSMLLVKNHPLDNYLINRRREIAALAKQHGVADRVVYIDCGPNPNILDRAKGMISVNSTMGTSALFHKVPVCAMGRAIYDIEGLTHQLGLDAFWKNPTMPDMAVYEQFRQTLIHNCQVRGRFVTAQGRKLGAKSCAERMLATPYVASVRTRISVPGNRDVELPDADQPIDDATGLRKTG